MRAELGLADEALLLVMLGIMRPGKGHEQLLRALQQLGDPGRPTVALAGDGPLRDELEILARGSSTRTLFLGFVDEVDRLLQAADLMVHPSLFDALPTALLQGLAHGLPIVASAVGGIPEIVGTDTGVLVPPGDIAALAGAITDLALDRPRRRAYGLTARAKFEQEFEVSVWAARLRHLYEEVLSEMISGGSADVHGPAGDVVP
jgi:glycosyltransferase involved in cell wall biosynthesis